MIARRPPGCLDEAAAREVLLLQAVEAVDPPTPAWTADDAAWATRAAREADDGRGGAEGFVAARAALAMRRLLPRLPALGAVWQARVGPARSLGAAVGLGLVVGLGADAIGSSQRINLLAPPIWAVVAWNLAVYLVLVVVALRGAAGRAPSRPGVVTRVAERLLRLGREATPPVDATTGAAVRAFAARWSAVAAPLAAMRATVLLHAAAGALGAGLVAGLYARGLVLDYRVAWESTFLTPAEVHAALATLLAPASRLSGIALPDVATVAALRTAHANPGAGAPAAPWIHLYAATLWMAVIGPRAVLALVVALRAARSAERLRLPFGDPYFRRLDLARRGDVARVLVCPYAQSPGEAAVAGLRALLAQVLGSTVQLEVAATTPFGGEDAVVAPRGPSGDAPTLVVALFDLAATPEPEHQGHFLTALAAAAGAAATALVDESAFRRRFGTADRRLTERRDAWSRLLSSLGAVPAFASLGDTAPAAAAVASLRAALQAPPG